MPAHPGSPALAAPPPLRLHTLAAPRLEDDAHARALEVAGRARLGQATCGRSRKPECLRGPRHKLHGAAREPPRAAGVLWAAQGSAARGCIAAARVRSGRVERLRCELAGGPGRLLGRACGAALLTVQASGGSGAGGLVSWRRAMTWRAGGARPATSAPPLTVCTAATHGEAEGGRSGR